MSQDWMQQGPPPPPPPPPPPAYNPYGYSGSPPPMGGSGAVFPWEDRARLGLVTALIETGKLLITQPKEAYSRLQPNGDLTSPLLFGLIVSWPVFIVSLVWQLLLGGMMGGFGGSAEAAGMSVVSVGIYAVCYPILYLIGVFIFAGIMHLALSLLKGLDQSNFGFEGTLKVVAYAYVGQVASVVPMIGSFITLGILIYLSINGLEVVHRTTQKNAILAVVLPLAVCCLCIVIMFFMFGAAMMAALSGASGG
jgi:hypothetical protein